ncbi:Crp/Fnr family transcriptional regulator [Spirosoma soli]|uniref:Crp/Fnr family transcriptional regulator n=1 Tax=Spirosoma soli TaxID=1770529 RepID=A0ABW5M9D2_9BACT
MFEDFMPYLRQHLPMLTAEQIELIRSASVVRKVRRKQRLLQAGEVCQYKMFVIRGLLRTYHITDAGHEYAMKFTAEHGFLTDPESYVHQTPSKLCIDALEPSDVLLWNHDDFENLRIAIPELNALSEHMITHSNIETQKRILLNISSTPEERYLNFMTTYPDIFRRVPLHMVASYLGVSRETLTRIRQGLLVAAKG